MKKKLSLALATAIFLGVMGWLIFSKHCKTPNDLEIKVALLTCVSELVGNEESDILNQVCKEMGRPADCEFADEDRDLFMAAAEQIALRCVHAKLEAQNMCIEGVEQKLRGAL